MKNSLAKLNNRVKMAEKKEPFTLKLDEEKCLIQRERKKLKKNEQSLGASRENSKRTKICVI